MLGAIWWNEAFQFEPGSSLLWPLGLVGNLATLEDLRLLLVVVPKGIDRFCLEVEGLGVGATSVGLAVCQPHW